MNLQLFQLFLHCFYGFSAIILFRLFSVFSAFSAFFPGVVLLVFPVILLTDGFIGFPCQRHGTGLFGVALEQPPALTSMISGMAGEVSMFAVIICPSPF